MLVTAAAIFVAGMHLIVTRSRKSFLILLLLATATTTNIVSCAITIIVGHGRGGREIVFCLARERISFVVCVENSQTGGSVRKWWVP